MATAPLNATETARLTLTRLATLRLPPTPENYQRIYSEIAGDSRAGNIDPQCVARAHLHAWKTRHAALADLCAGLEHSLNQTDWEGFFDAMLPALTLRVEGENPWGVLLKTFIRQWERRQKSLSHLQKQRAIDQLVHKNGQDAAALAAGLGQLLAKWEALPDGPVASLSDQAITPRHASHATGSIALLLDETPAEALVEWRDLLAYLLKYGIAPRLAHVEELESRALALSAEVKHLKTLDDKEGLATLQATLKDFLIKIELHEDIDRNLQDKLLSLLKLFLENVSELMLDDQWLSGQLSNMRQLLREPIRASALSSFEEQFKEIIYKQGVLKNNLIEARQALKTMASLIISGIEQVSTTTGLYYQRLQVYSEQIQATEDLDEINRVVQEIIGHSRDVEAYARQWFDELNNARQQMEQAEERIRVLEKELEEVSQLLQEDPLTGALNRRGMAMAFVQCFSRAKRLQSLLSVALMDLDHFKQVNDQYGHDLGDQLLKYLVQAFKTHLRPTDVLARSGGEEFVILLPETPLGQARQVMQRLQQSLTRMPFQHNGVTLKVAFSAGLVQWDQKANMETLLERADQAMYQAKKAGRGRIVEVSVEKED